MVGSFNRKIVINILLSILFFLLIPINLAWAANASVIVTIDHNYDGTYYLLLDRENPLKFGICRNPESNKLKLKVFELGTGRMIHNSDFKTGYQSPRPDETKKCGESGQSDIYGPKIEGVTYKPSQPGTWSIKAVYYNEANEIVLARTMPFQVVTELPSDEEPDPGDTEGLDPTFNLSVDVGNIDDFTIHGNPSLSMPWDIANKILTELLLIAGILALIAFIWAGYMMIFSGGDPGRADKGKKMLVFAFIGIVLIILSYQLIRAVDIFSNPGPEAPEVKYD